jgi:hypothetical protein
MSDESKRIIVDSDWKQQAQREKEQLAEQLEQHPREAPPASFTELVNVLLMQVMVGLGMVGGPGGERIPPNIEAAKHFIDLLEVLEQKTRNNLTPEEKKLLDQVLYEIRMMYVQLNAAIAQAIAEQGGAARPGDGSGAPSIAAP